MNRDFGDAFEKSKTPENKINNFKREKDDTSDLNKSNNPHQLIIKENYISDTQNRSRSRYTSRLLPEISHGPKLYQQLIGKNRQKSYFYNIIVLVTFNINMAHFCFPYITNHNGLLLTLLTLILCAVFSYICQTALVRYISHNRDLTQCNYAVIIENNFGTFFAQLLEFLVMIWYGILYIICITTCKHRFIKLK